MFYAKLMPTTKYPEKNKIDFLYTKNPVVILVSPAKKCLNLAVKLRCIQSQLKVVDNSENKYLSKEYAKITF